MSTHNQVEQRCASAVTAIRGMIYAEILQGEIEKIMLGVFSDKNEDVINTKSPTALPGMSCFL